MSTESIPILTRADRSKYTQRLLGGFRNFPVGNCVPCKIWKAEVDEEQKSVYLTFKYGPYKTEEDLDIVAKYVSKHYTYSNGGFRELMGLISSLSLEPPQFLDFFEDPALFLANLCNQLNKLIPVDVCINTTEERVQTNRILWNTIVNSNITLLKEV